MLLSTCRADLQGQLNEDYRLNEDYLEGKNTGDYEDKTGDELWRPEKGIDYWEKASTEETHKFLNHVFKGKASLLVNHLVDSGDLSENDLQEILNVMRG